METHKKLCSNDSNILTESVLRCLSRNGLDRVIDLLQENSEKLSSLTALSLPQILSLRSDILEKYSATVINGACLYNKLILNSQLETGIQSLDNLLKGGLPHRHITEICGLAGSGKSQLSMQIAINTARNSEGSILYIDTKGDFSAIRVQKNLDNSGCSYQQMASIMSRINIVHIWKMDTMITLLEKLCSQSIVINDLSVIIIDSLPSLMFQYLGDDCKTGLTLLNIFTNKCNKLCRSLNLSVICVNIQSRWIDKEIIDLEDPEASTSNKETMVEKKFRCLGKYWQHIPALVLQIERSPASTKCAETNGSIRATVLKSNYSEINSCCHLTISDLGVI